MERLDELKIKLAEVDRLIGDILDSEPESEHGKYGKEIGALFQEMNWIFIMEKRMQLMSMQRQAVKLCRLL